MTILYSCILLFGIADDLILEFEVNRYRTFLHTRALLFFKEKKVDEVKNWNSEELEKDN